jgi:hypothetical protein
MCPRCFRLKRAEFKPRWRRRPPDPGRFRERVTPVLDRRREKPQNRHDLQPWSVCSAKFIRSLEKAIRVQRARRWWPAKNALIAQWDRAQERFEGPW